MWGEQTPVSLSNKWVQNFHFTRWKELWGWMVMMADSTMKALAPLNCTFKNGWGEKKKSYQKKKKMVEGTSMAAQWKWLRPFNAGGTGSNHSWGSKIPHTAQHGEKKRWNGKLYVYFTIKIWGKVNVSRVDSIYLIWLFFFSLTCIISNFEHFSPKLLNSFCFI